MRFAPARPRKSSRWSFPYKMTEFLCGIEERRRQASLSLDPLRQTQLSQFFTPVAVARHMASLVSCTEPEPILLDAGAGIGILFAAVVEMLCLRPDPPKKITVYAYETDPLLVALAQQTLDDCTQFAIEYGVLCAGQVYCGDFLRLAAQQIQPDLLDASDSVQLQPHIAILNPPYRKIGVGSIERHTLRRLAIETTNLYTGFVAVAMRLIARNGELIAITPRSFCNGSYFRPFRTDLLQRTALTHLHLFHSRTDAFRESDVLQETLIFRLQTGIPQPQEVKIAHLTTLPSEVGELPVAFSQVVKDNDPERYFHIPEGTSRGLIHQVSLSELGLRVSTGRVVDFRVATYLRPSPDLTTAPLIYPVHCRDMRVCWPDLEAKKPNGLVTNEETSSLCVPNGNYVLVKRFSSKEQPRRVMAYVYEAEDFERAEKTGVGFENHLNYYHEAGKGIDIALAHGLAAYLNSEEVDRYFRQFSGHTQVNATDLKNLSYPSRDELMLQGKLLLGEAG